MNESHMGLRWLQTHGRPIDQAVVNYFRGKGDAKTVVDALKSYTNIDGGFGRALEPDVRLEGSSVLATTIALQKLSLINASSSHPLVKGAMNFLKGCFNSEARAWDIVPPNVDSAPHAPWWDYKEVTHHMINPRAEIVGYMYRWPETINTSIRDELTQELRTHLLTTNELEMHDILVYGRMLQSPGLPIGLQEELRESFHALVLKAVTTKPEDWDNYGLTPEPSPHLLAC